MNSMKPLIDWRSMSAVKPDAGEKTSASRAASYKYIVSILMRLLGSKLICNTFATLRRGCDFRDRAGASFQLSGDQPCVSLAGAKGGG